MNINFWTLIYPIPGTYFLFCVQASYFLENHGPVFLYFFTFQAWGGIGGKPVASFKNVCDILIIAVTDVGSN